MAIAAGGWVPFVSGTIFVVAAVVGEIGALKIQHPFLYIHAVTTFCVCLFVFICCVADAANGWTTAEFAMYSPTIVDLLVGILSFVMARSVHKYSNKFHSEINKSLRGESDLPVNADCTEMREAESRDGSMFE